MEAHPSARHHRHRRSRTRLMTSSRSCMRFCHRHLTSAALSRLTSAPHAVTAAWRIPARRSTLLDLMGLEQG